MINYFVILSFYLVLPKHPSKALVAFHSQPRIKINTTVPVKNDIFMHWFFIYLLFTASGYCLIMKIILTVLIGSFRRETEQSQSFYAMFRPHVHNTSVIIHLKYWFVDSHRYSETGQHTRNPIMVGVEWRVAALLFYAFVARLKPNQQHCGPTSAITLIIKMIIMQVKNYRLQIIAAKIIYKTFFSIRAIWKIKL